LAYSIASDKRGYVQL